MSNIIHTEGLSKTFLDGGGKELNILVSISTEFPLNQTLSIMGSSGSGKSTLLHLLGGLDRPTAGKVFFKGEEIFKLSPDMLSKWRNQKIGFVFQAHHLLPDFTARENVIIPGLIFGKNKISSFRRAASLLDQVGLADRMEHKPSQLSGGEQQRVAIARALFNGPEMILADEPTGNLDQQTGRKISELLKSICYEQKASLILVTHNPEVAARMDNHLVLKNGNLIKTDNSRVN